MPQRCRLGGRCRSAQTGPPRTAQQRLRPAGSAGPAPRRRGSAPLVPCSSRPPRLRSSRPPLQQAHGPLALAEYAGQRRAVHRRSERQRRRITGRAAELDRFLPVGERIVRSLCSATCSARASARTRCAVAARPGGRGWRSATRQQSSTAPRPWPRTSQDRRPSQRGIGVTRTEGRFHRPADIGRELADRAEPGGAVPAVGDIGDRNHPAGMPGARHGQVPGRG